MRFTEHLGRIAFRALIWALAGALFGGVFAGLGAALSQASLSPWLVFMVSAGVGGAITASFFGAMQVALIGTMVGVLTAIGYLVTMEGSSRLAAVMGVAAVAGAIAGMLWSTDEAMRKRPLGQIATGLISGLIAGPATFFLANVAGILQQAVLVAALAVAFVGILYIISSRWVLALCSDWITTKLSGPLVAAINAIAVAACMWLVASTAMGIAGSAEAASLDRILIEIPLGLLGGALGGAAGGALLEVAGMERSDYSI
jgi:hypothetical protein